MEAEVLNILLIEDNPGDIRLVEEMLCDIRDLSINLIVAENIKTGLKYIATELIHVILLDLNLPDSQGIQTFKQVYKFALDVPVIIMSVLSDKELIYEAMKGGAQGYLIKGKLENDSLVCALRYVIWNHHHTV